MHNIGFAMTCMCGLPGDPVEMVLIWEYSSVNVGFILCILLLL